MPLRSPTGAPQVGKRAGQAHKEGTHAPRPRRPLTRAAASAPCERAPACRLTGRSGSPLPAPVSHHIEAIRPLQRRADENLSRSHRPRETVRAL